MAFRERIPRERGEALGSGGGRVNRAERQPVRQKQSEGGSLRDGAESRRGRQVELDSNRVVPWSEGSRAKTFLFKNFPPSCTDKELIAKFQEVEAVVDLFCPKKKDVHGKRFGFVRFKLEQEEDGELMLDKVNTLWINTYKLRVFLPRFERSMQQRAIPPPKPAPSKGTPTPKAVPAALIEEGRSFLNVVKGTTAIKIPKNSESMRVMFIPTAEDKEWLEGAMVGLLKKDFSWEEYNKDIQNEVENSLSLKTLGEDLILILKTDDAVEGKGWDSDWEKH